METASHPVLTRPREADSPRRLIGAVVAICAAGILGIAAWLTPATQGLGTHEAMGLPQCGWITLMDMPCPTCGMTTAFAHAADGHLVTSFLTQPLGSILAVGTAMAFLTGMFIALTGSRIGSLFGRLWGRSSGWIIAGLVLVSWLYKVLSHRGMI